jgi:hypothetical protein
LNRLILLIKVVVKAIRELADVDPESIRQVSSGSWTQRLHINLCNPEIVSRNSFMDYSRPSKCAASIQFCGGYWEIWWNCLASEMKYLSIITLD